MTAELKSEIDKVIDAMKSIKPEEVKAYLNYIKSNLSVRRGRPATVEIPAGMTDPDEIKRYRKRVIMNRYNAKKRLKSQKA